MRNQTARVNLDYMVHLASQPDWATEQARNVDDYNLDNGARYGDDPIPTYLKPNFISRGQRDLLDKAVTRITGALETVVDLWLEDEDLQELWGVSEAERELYQVDPGYPGAIQIARFDGFLQGGDLKFLEFNCDSPGGPGYGDVIAEAFRGHLLDSGRLGTWYRVTEQRRVPPLARTLKRCYDAWRKGRDHPEDPFVVLADWRDVDSRPDIEITTRRFGDLGLEAAMADPRDLTLDGDRLMLEDRQVDVIYKRVIVEELVREPAARDLVEAYKAGAVCMVNAPRSCIVGNKKILALLHRPGIQRELTPEQRVAVDRFVPWTKILQPGKTRVEGYTVHLRDFVLDNKNRLVLKAAQGYGGRQVHLGFETSEEEWGHLVDSHIEDGTWVVQELVDIPKELYPVVDDGQVYMKLLNVNINPFVFGGEYAGAYTRVSTESVINVSHGGGIVPTMTIQDIEEGLP